MNTPTRIEGRTKRHIIKAIFCALIACIIAFYGIPALGFATEDQDSSAQNTEQTEVADIASNDESSYRAATNAVADSDEAVADNGESADAAQSPAPSSGTKPDSSNAGGKSGGSSKKAAATSNSDGSTVKASASSEYTIRWTDEDGSLLATTTVAAGETPVYPNEDPTKKEDENYTYTFSGWSPNLAPATNDRNYRAVYAATAKQEDTPSTDGKLHIKIDYIIYNIHEIPWSTEFTISNNGSKKINHNGTYSYVGGANRTAGYYGVSYKFMNAFVLSTGSAVLDGNNSDDRPCITRIAYKDGVATITYTNGETETRTTGNLTITPVYSATPDWFLNYNYIDNISTGSGAWSNMDGVESYTHTFKEPDSQPHYKFVDWWQEDTGETFAPGDSYTYDGGPSTYHPAGEQIVINTYARWQPSVTVNYYDWEGNLLEDGTVEKFESIDVYASAPAHDVEGAKFLGWYDEDGNRLDEGFAYGLPAITKEQVDRTEYNVYARYSTSYTVEHSLQDLDDPNSYTLTDTDTIVDVILGSEVFADPNTYTGFTFNPEIEGTVQSATVEAGTTVLKLFYERNTYTVTYEYTGDVPSNASALPAQQTYRYGEKVTIAPDATAEGYTFSGWSEKSAFDMPAENVVITGSFTPVEEEPAADSDSDKSAMPATGDTMPIALLAIVLVAAAVAFVSKRRGMLN